MIFVDTSFLVALRTRRDAHHSEALSLLERFGHRPLVTSNLVRGETWTFLRRRRGHAPAVSFLDSLAHSRIRVVRVAEELENQALAWLRWREEREYSFVDATSFAVMKSMRIGEAFAFDGDFSASGFVELRP